MPAHRRTLSRNMELTRHRDLRDGAAVWVRYKTPRVLGTRLRRSIHTEVAIVGAGISGALVAQSLTEIGIRPLIVDRRHAALLGSTAASTALLQFELDTPLTLLGASIGRRRAERIWTASRDAVNELRTRTARLRIDAHFHSRPSLYLAGNVLDSKGLRKEALQRQRIGLSTEYLDRRALRHHFGIDRAAALLSHGNAEANPVQLAAGFLRNAMKAGAHFHAPHDIVAIQRNRRSTTLTTEDGFEIEARHVVLCTGYELAKIVPAADNKVFSTWAIATRAQPGNIWPQKALIWEAAEPYLYIRATADGRVICGGEDEQFSNPEKRDSLTAAKIRRIEGKLLKILPKLDTRALISWAGSFGASADSMPTIGEIPGFPKCYAVLGYGGNGITFSMLAAKLITAAIAGRKDSDAELFGFGR